MNYSLLSVKKLLLLKPVLITATALVVAIAGCKKDDVASDEISEEEVIESVSQSVEATSGGVTEQTGQSVDIALRGTNAGRCGVERDSAITRTNAPGSRVAYTMNLNWHWILRCTSNVPSKIDLTVNGRITYDAPRMSSDDQSTGNYQITDLLPAKPEYNVAFSIERNGTQQSKIRQQRSFTSKTIITGTDIKVDKTTRQISSGTAHVIFNGTVSTGRTFSRNATVTFLGNRSAIITLGNGTTKTITW